MQDRVIQIGLAVLESVLARAANTLWDDLWYQVTMLLGEAEIKWNESKQGATRKAWVIDETMKWLDAKVQLSGFKRFLVKLVFSKTLDAIISSLNDQLGHGWMDKAEGIKVRLEELLPVID